MVDWHSVLRARVALLRLAPADEAELVEELSQHLEEMYRELESGGASPEDAYRQTLSELDDMHALRSGLDDIQHMPAREPVPIGDTTSRTLLADVRRDLRYAGRVLRANPLFVCFVVATLGLGIGANTTVFTIINALLLRPLPVAAPSELVVVSSSATIQANALLPLSYPALAEYAAHSRAFRSLAGCARMRALSWQTEGAAPQGLLTEFVTGNYFPTLGVTAAAGRMFGPEADERGRAAAVAVMNYGTWQTRFGGAPDIVGRTLRLNGVPVTVIGVVRPGFIGMNGLVGPDVWLPFGLAEQLLPDDMRSVETDRSKAVLQGVARLNPGVTVSQAQAEMAALASALARDYPSTDHGRAIAVRPIGDLLFSGGARQVRVAGAVLAAVAGLVLLIACSNVANLLLARAAVRQQELAVRVALGASRGRLVRQLLTESLCLGLLSGAVGLALGYVGLRLLAGTLPPTGTFVTARLDRTVLLFSLLLSLATGFLFGTMPAISASRAGVAGALNAARAAGRHAWRATVANALLVGQVALSFVLLAAAALFLRSMQRAYEIDPGFKPDHLAVFITNPGQAGYGAAQTHAFYQHVGRRVAGLPGVESVSWASNLPLFAWPIEGLRIEGRVPESSSERLAAIVNTVDLQYFATAGVAIDAGREFTPADGAASLSVAIVNETLARNYWPGGVALGKRLQVPGERQLRLVVGIARTANYTSWGEPPQPCVYVPLAQHPSPAMTLYVRASGDPASILRPVAREIAAAGPPVLISGIRTGAQIVDGSLYKARTGMTMLGAFGLLALALASVGLYGIVAYAVHERRREIGVRLALGATQSRVRRLILKQGMSLVLFGLAIGVAAALLVGRALSGLLYGIGASDPLSLALASLVLGAVALMACYLPARWAMRVDPIVELRQM